MPHRTWFSILLVSATTVACAPNTRLPEQPAPAAAEHVLTLVSDTLLIDTTYHSMEGPYHQLRFTMGPDQRADTLWITGITADVVTPDLAELPLEYFCHANLDYDPELHRSIFGSARATSSRLFTLSQGNETMRFPAGFGIPVRSDEPLNLTTQVLSNNGVDTAKEMRVRIRLHYVRKGERPMKSLFPASATAMVSTDGHEGHFGMHADHEVGSATNGVAKSGHEYRDALGQRFSGHWVVPPGRHSVRTVVTEWLNLDADTRVHYIGVHVHPFARRITLRDMASGQDVFTSNVTPLDGRIGIAQATDFSSVQGFQLFAGRNYEVVADYENPTAQPVDAMAVLFLYLRDPQLDR